MDRLLKTSSEKEKPDTSKMRTETTSDINREKEKKRESRYERNNRIAAALAKELWPNEPWE